ncbi:MAG: Hsp20/alpha crystallin family protein [Candidatus Obscuribacterales bacterium]|nr:Hsp20/alpha crystallin family protein [Candidatus Obscuribacterales bacterium]
MSSELNPFNWGRSNSPAKRDSSHPSFLGFDRLLDDLFHPDMSLLPTFTKDFVPSIDVSEDDKEVRIECELPGIEEKDIDLNLADNRLTIKGEKRSEEESHDKGTRKNERRYGAFSRSIDLPSGLDLENADASFKNGVLCVKFQKTEEYRKHSRSIPIGDKSEKKNKKS